MKKLFSSLAALLLLTLPLVAKQQPRNHRQTKGGYLFAHMTNDNYARLFYSLSRDGIHWEQLNDGKIVAPSYFGHPTISRGKGGIYYMISLTTGSIPRQPVLFYSKDLVEWKERPLKLEHFDVSDQGYANDVYCYGAPKIFYDKKSRQYIITWHVGLTGKDGNESEWMTKRTFYILTKDFNTFTKPRKLFDFTGSDSDMATIDVIIKEHKGTYYAIIKDERWPNKFTHCPTGKTIRVATSKKLTEGWSNPGVAITPSWHEAPTVVPSPDGKEWYLYTERYPHRYVMYKAPALDSPHWQEVTLSAPHMRHGWVQPLSEREYRHLKKSFPNKK